jgi:hypothetical protein
VTEVWLPRTDAGVVAQAAVVFPLLLVALAAVRRDRELRLLVAGLTVFVAALFALRTLH